MACGSSLYTLSGTVSDGSDPEQLSYQLEHFDQLAWQGESVSFNASGDKCQLKLDPQFVVTSRIIETCVCLAALSGQSPRNTSNVVDCFHRARKVVAAQLKSHGELISLANPLAIYPRKD